MTIFLAAIVCTGREIIINFLVGTLAVLGPTLRCSTDDYTSHHDHRGERGARTHTAKFAGGLFYYWSQFFLCEHRRHFFSACFAEHSQSFNDFILFCGVHVRGKQLITKPRRPRPGRMAYQQAPSTASTGQSTGRGL